MKERRAEKRRKRGPFLLLSLPLSFAVSFPFTPFQRKLAAWHIRGQGKIRDGAT